MLDSKINILLIDDDELLLRALSRTLNRLYRQAEIVCLQFPGEFTNCIDANGAPDIIFCDSVMPVLSGVEVLKKAKELCPAAIRCLLTGDLNESYQWQVNNTIHFHLVKPFTQVHLKQVVESAILLKSLPISQATRVVLGQLAELPYLSTVAHSVLGELQNDEPDINALTKQVSHDPIMSGKVLQVANSAFMGFSSHTTDFKQAIIRIGLDGLKAIVVCCELSQRFVNNTKKDALNELVNRAFLKANMGQSLSKMLGLSNQDQSLSFAVGLLSGVGVLTHFCIIQHTKDKGRVSKYALTAYLLALWGFEEQVVRAQLIDDLPIDKTVSLTLIHKVVDRVSEQNTFDLGIQEYNLLDELMMLQATQDWFFEWQRAEKGLV